MKRTSFVVLNYNNLTDSRACIDSILSLDNQEDISIVLVDNASTDGSGQELKKMYEDRNNPQGRIRVILKDENDGFSRGNNRGAKLAIEAFEPDFLVVSNNDTVFEQKDFLKILYREYEKEPFDIAGPDIVDSFGLHQNPMAKELPGLKAVNRTILLNSLVLKIYDLCYPLLKKYLRRKAAGVDSEGYRDYQEDICLNGASMIYSSSYIEERVKKNPSAALFYPETEFYYEEFIQQLYCRRNNKRVVYLPSLLVMHKEMGSTKRLDDRDEKKRWRFVIEHLISGARVYKEYLMGEE